MKRVLCGMKPPRLSGAHRLLKCAGIFCAAGFALTLLWSCSGSFSFGGAMDVGVTTGGQQDIAAARKTIEEGGIPDPDSITVEGFLSEHSIPVVEPDGAGDLYATAAVAWNTPFDAFTPLVTVQVGFGTTLDADAFSRQPLNVVVVIDRSGSMEDEIDQRSGTSKLEAVKIAIDRLLANLDHGDLISIVTFNDESVTRLEAVAGDNIAAVKTALDTIEAEGATDLDAGMRNGYRVAKRNRTDGRQDRLIVFTDALLTVHVETQADDLIATMEEYADDDIGATLFGVGTDFGHETADRIAQVRGANYFFLSDYDRIVTVFDEEFDLLVTPAAYDITMSVSVPYEFDVEGVYGIPEPDALGHELDLELPTLFLSNRQGGGAVVVRLRAGALVDFDTASTVASIDLTYKASNGQTKSQSTIAAKLPAGSAEDASTPYFQTINAQRTVLLLDTALVLKSACEDAYAQYWWEDTQRSQAADRLTDFLPYFDELAADLPDATSDTSRTLSQERDLIVQLLSNIRSGLPFYGID